MSKLDDIGRVPPSDIEIEKAVLGSMLLEHSGCKVAIELLTSEVFYVGAHGTIFRAIKTLFDAKTPVDILTVMTELKRIHELQNVGGAYELSQLTSKVASSENTEIHCRILLQHFFKREIIRTSINRINMAYDSFSDSFDLIAGAKEDIKNIEGFIKTNKIVDTNDVIDKVLENVELARKGSGITGFSTGIKTLDFAIMGLRKKLKYLIAAQSGEGKSALAKTIAVSLAHKQGIPGIFFSLEVTSDMFMVGCLSEILNIPNERIQKGELTDEEQGSIVKLKNTLFTRSLIIDDRGALSPDEIKITLRKLKESHKIEWFCVDYINLQKLKGKEHKNKSKEERVADIVNENKNMAKELDLVCIELAQFTKEISKREGGKPHVGDLKDSAALEQSADVIILVYRPEKHAQKDYKGMDTQGLAELIIAKNKYGPMKNLITKFSAQHTSFSDHESGREWAPDPF